jgi:16S rRNA (guanine527-N7)-methyltransferase
MTPAPLANWPPEPAGHHTRGPVQPDTSDSGVAFDAPSIAAHARVLGVELNEAQSEKLARFAHLLTRWNRIHNLTAITRPEELLSVHLLDSLSLAPELPAVPPLKILDAGAGAGLPGLPLAIALPGHHFTLVDAVSKKCAFMTQARLELGLHNVEVLHRRLEQLRGARFDVIVSRALGSLAALVSLTRPALAPRGRWIAMKGRLPQQELAQLPADVVAARTVTLRVPLLDQERHLVVLQPVASRPEERT